MVDPTAEVTKFVFLRGVQEASSLISVAPEAITNNLLFTDYDNLCVLKRLRQKIIEYGQKKGTRKTARKFGLMEKHVTEMLKDYLKEALANPNEEYYPHDTYERFTQTFIQMLPIHSNKSVQVKRAREDSCSSPDLSKEERKSRNYNTAEKITAVREFMKRSNQAAASRELKIPTPSLIRWRDKIKNSVFQAIHVESLYHPEKRGHKRDKMFQELDNALYEWYVQNKDHITDVDKALVEKASRLATIDNTEPRISEEWLREFKKHYNI